MTISSVSSIKLVLNRCYGGFTLSLAATKWLAERGCAPAAEVLNDPTFFWDFEGEDFHGEFKGWRGCKIPRHSPLLVECVETLGDSASGDCSDLKVVEVAGNRYIVEEYDGYEGVRTPDSIKWITVE